MGHNLHHEEGKSLKFHFDEFKSFVMELYNLDFNLDDEGLDIQLSCPLPILGRLFCMESGDKL